MPKKGASKAAKNAAANKQAKLINDKTFGLKNKKKSKRVQQYVQTVKTNAAAAGKSVAQMKAEQARQKSKVAKKAAAAAEAEMNALFQTVTTKRTVVPLGVNPKSIVCEFYRAGKCKKGRKCKFSHDVAVERKVAKRDLYSDTREGDTMDTWDQSKLEDVVKQKATKGGGKTLNQTEIVCKYFLDAIEKSKYGWFWECDNGVNCIYQHKLPPGFVLKTDKDAAAAQDDDGPTLEEKIEEDRKKLDISKCTPVTPDTFAAWKIAQKQKRERAVEDKRKEEVKKAGGRGLGVMSGRELFKFDATLFVDDDDAADDDAYEEEQEGAADEAQAINEDLFMDDEDLPDDSDDED